MTDDSTIDNQGIEVHEMIDIESIELSSSSSTIVEELGWETVQPEGDGEVYLVDNDDAPHWRLDDSEEDSERDLADLEAQHLHLAAGLTDLRRAAAKRETSLRERLTRREALLRQRQAELDAQAAQIAALTLECEGLRARLGEQAHETPVEQAGNEAAAPGDGPETGMTSVVKLMEKRLAEGESELTDAREEADRLQLERADLTDALAERGSQVAKLLARLTRSTRRSQRRDEFDTGLGDQLDQPVGDETDAMDLTQAGSEEPTLAIDEPEQETVAPTPPEQAAMPAPPAPDAAPHEERRVHTAAARAPGRQRRRRTGAGIRRYLIAVDPAREEVCELAKRRMYVGRGEEADVRVSDATASRLHAVLYLQRGSTVVEDASSTNGVYVNTQRVRRAVLLDGDTVAFGTTRFQYRVGPAVVSNS